MRRRDPSRRPRRRTAAAALAAALSLAAPAARAELGWLDEPQGRSDLDTLLAPPGRPLGGLNAEQDPALSPNGRWLAYSAFVDGNWDIWLRDLAAGPGELPRRLTDHVAADLRPSFSPDGDAILFVSQREDAAGDLWEIPLSRWTGRLRVKEPRPLLRRPGAQDHPARAADGALLWDEEGPAGRRVMRREGLGAPRELACPAALPRPGHGGLYLLAVPDSQRVSLEWLADAELKRAGPDTPRRVVWRPAGALVDVRPGPEGRLWAITLEEDAPPRPGADLAAPSQLWQLEREGTRPPRPLLEQGRAPRQLALAGRRLVFTEDERPALLWLEDADGRFPVGGGQSTPGGAPGGAAVAASDWLELARRYQGDALGLPLLQTIQAAWPGSPAADLAALKEMRLRMLAGGRAEVLRARLEELRGWMRGPEARARLEAMQWEIDLRERGAADTSPLEELARRGLGQGMPGAAAEARLARARLELEAGRLDRALSALLDLESLPDSLPEQADGLALKVRAWEGLGQTEAARGALATLAAEHADRPELLADWLRRDLAGLSGLTDSRARLRLRERLAVFGGIPPLRLALLVELAQREAAAGRDGRAVAREDLRLALEEQPAELGPFQRRAWTQGQGLQADLRRADGDLDGALDGLRRADAALVAAAEPALAGLLRLKRIDWLLERAAAATTTADWDAAEADTRQILQLDPTETRAWRLRLEALARLGRLEAEERLLRERRAAAGRKAVTLRGAALARRAVETWALGLLLSWRAESDPSWLPESDLLLEETLSLDDRLAPACLTLSWNLSRELQLATGRRGGLKGLLRELGSGREKLRRLRHRGLGGMEDPDEESLRDRAILLTERGLRWTDPARDPDLAAALATNLGNLHFSLGEFGALKARQAWERRLEISPGFRGARERLSFLTNLGTARQWSGDLERAAADLDSAQALAARLNLLPERRELMSRLAMLAGERGRPVEAQTWLRQVLALESDPGQRALLWRNLAMVQMELGDDEARRSLAEAAREAAAGPWPMEPAQNWLRIRLLGVSVPLWNFPGLYTGQGRLDWGAAEEEALRQALADEMNGRRGALDERLGGLNARRRLLRRQGDVDGMLRVDLAIARELAALGRWEAAARRFQEAARLAREAVLAGPEARAVEGAMACLLLCRRAPAHPDAAALADLAPVLRAELETLLARAALFPADQRLRLELLRVQDLEDQAGEADPVAGLLARGRALLALEDLETWRKEAGLAWTAHQRLSLDLAWARLLTATGDPEEAAERLAGWPAGRLPAESALLVAAARLQAARLSGDREEAKAAGRELRQSLLDLPAEPDRLLTLRRCTAALDLLDEQARGEAETAHAANWRAWWEGRRLWEQADPPFPSQAWTNAWGTLRADLAQRDRWAEEAMLGTAGADSSLAAADSLLAATRLAAGAREARLRLWLEPAGGSPDRAALRARGLGWVGVDADPGTRLVACPEVHQVLSALPMLAPESASLVGEGGGSGRPGLRRVSAAALEVGGAAGMEGRVVGLDGVLHLVPGAPQAAWLELDGRRVPLRSLMGLDLPGELLVVGEVDWQGEDPARWREGWLVVERLLAQCGLRRALLPGPGQGRRGAALEDLLLDQLADSAGAVPPGWWGAGALPLTPAERLAGRRRGLEDLVRFGNECRRQEEHGAAWRAYRRALRLAVQLGDGEAAGRLARLGAVSALDGGRPGEALDLLLEELARTDPARVEWERVSGRLVQLADLAGREEEADSLWQRLVVEGYPVGAPWDAPAPAPAAPEALRAALESRLAALEARGARERASALARAAGLRPEGGDPRRALFLARLYLDTESVPVARECLDTAGLRWEDLDSLETLDAHELRFLVALRLGDLAAARAAMDGAVAQAAAIGLAGERLALHLQRRADLAWSLGRYEDCARLLDQAAAVLPPGDARLALGLANTRGLLATELDEVDEAASQFARAQALGLRLGDPLELSAVHNNQSRLLQRAGRWVEALEACRRALEQDSLSGSRRRALATLRNRAASTRGLLGPDLRLPEAWLSLPEGLLRQRHATAELGRLARELAEGARAARGLGEERDACRLELELARLRHELGEDREALATAQACVVRADSLLFSREALEASLVAGQALRGLRREREAEEWLGQALARAEEETARLAALRFDPGRGLMQRLITDELVALAAPARPWEALLASERGRSLGLQEMTARRHGEEAPAAPAQLDRRGLERLLGEALAPGQALLGWHLGRAGGWGFLWQDGDLRAWALPAPGDSIRALVALHRARIVGFLSPEETGRRLAAWLLPPAWLDRPPARAWLLPQGELHELAFESLLLADGSWLGARTALCRSGSLAEVARSARLPGGAGAGAVWSDPRVPGQEPLEYTALEGEELVRLFPDSRLRQGGDARKADLEGDGAARRFRHFACHGRHDPRSPDGSALLLGPDAGDDGRLRAPEIAVMDLPTGLTVLSACETGLGRGGEEASAGLPRAFLAAGSRGVVASLWKVDDLATAVLVKHLYRALAQGRPADLALQDAQAAVRDWVHPHPAYWAAFCLTGQPLPEPARPAGR